MDGETGLRLQDVWPDLSNEINQCVCVYVRVRVCMGKCTHLLKWQLMAATQTTNLSSVE